MVVVVSDVKSNLPKIKELGEKLSSLPNESIYKKAINEINEMFESERLLIYLVSSDSKKLKHYETLYTKLSGVLNQFK